jgi:hypothetical protein
VTRLDRGTACTCDTQTDRCTPFRVDPVPCKRERDCWVEDKPVPHPVARPKHIKRAFRGCEDGEIPPICEDGVCKLGLPFLC